MITQKEREDIDKLELCNTKILNLIFSTARDDIITYALSNASVSILINVLEKTHIETTAEEAYNNVSIKGAHCDFYYLSKYTMVESVAIKLFEHFKEQATHEEMMSVVLYAKHMSIVDIAFKIARVHVSHAEAVEFAKFGRTEWIRVDAFNALVMEERLTQDELQHIVDYSLSSENKQKASDMLEGGCPHIGNMMDKEEEKE